MDHWNPRLHENRNPVFVPKNPDYHLTTDLTEKAIAFPFKFTGKIEEWSSN